MFKLCWAQKKVPPTAPQAQDASASLVDSDDDDIGQPQRTPLKLFVEGEDLKLKLVGVVVTIFQGSSYDEMFRTVQPTTVPGERISTYSLECSSVGQLHDYLAAPMPMPDSWGKLVEEVQSVEADSVVFNWECCSGCGDNCFPGGRAPARGSRSARLSQQGSPTMRLMGLALRNGHTVMCSDFSLKSLLAEWSEEQLGPNPFMRLGSCDAWFKLEFIPSDLQQEEVPQQLQVVGELCREQGQARVQAMDNTILFTVNPERKHTQLYDLKVLTVATETDSLEGDPAQMADEMKCSVGEGNGLKRGVAGHVALTYASGGQLIASMGHWIELTRLDTSAEAVWQVAAKNFGESEMKGLQAEYMSKQTNTERFECVQKQAQMLVSKSVPTRMKCRSKF